MNIKENICSFWVETLCQGQKISEANFYFQRKKWLLFSTEGRKNSFSKRNKCSSQSFFAPGIMFFCLEDTFSWGFIL